MWEARRDDDKDEDEDEEEGRGEENALKTIVYYNIYCIFFELFF